MNSSEYGVEVWLKVHFIRKRLLKEHLIEKTPKEILLSIKGLIPLQYKGDKVYLVKILTTIGNSDTLKIYFAERR